MIENMVLTSYLDKSYFAQAKIDMSQASNDVARQVETPSKRTIFVARHNFRWLMYTMTAKQVNAAI